MCFTDDFKKLNSADKAMRNKYLSYVKSSAVNSELENVYYSEKSDCFIVADIENNNVYLHSVLYKNYIPLFLKNLHTFLDKAKKFGKFQI